MWHDSFACDAKNVCTSASSSNVEEEEKGGMEIDSSRRVTNSDLTPPILSPRDLSMSLSFPTVNLSCSTFAPVDVTTPPAAATDATSEALVAGAKVCV